MSEGTSYGGELLLPDETIAALRTAQAEGQTIHEMSPLATLALAEHQGQFTTTTRQHPGSFPHYLQGRGVERILEDNARRAAGRLLQLQEFGGRSPEHEITAADMLQLFKDIVEASLGATEVHATGQRIVDRQIKDGRLVYRDPWDVNGPGYRPPKKQNRAVVAESLHIAVQNAADRNALTEMYRALLHRRQADRGVPPMRISSDRQGLTITGFGEKTNREFGATVVSLGTIGLAGEQNERTEAGQRGIIMPLLKLTQQHHGRLGTTFPRAATDIFDQIDNYYHNVLAGNKIATDGNGRALEVREYLQVLAGDLGLSQAIREAMAASCALRGGDNTEQEELRLLRLSVVGDKILRRVNVNRDYAALIALLNNDGRYPGPPPPRTSNMGEAIGDHVLKTDKSAWENILDGAELFLAVSGGFLDASLFLLRAAPGIEKYLRRVQKDKRTWERLKEEAEADQALTQHNVEALLARAGQV